MGRWTRPLTNISTALLLTVAAWVLVHSLEPIRSHYYGRDLGWYLDATRALLDDGTWYLPRQLNGPYEIAGGDVLYPPVAGWFFVPWLMLPTWLFIAAPLAITGWVVYRLRPAHWAWPLLAACLIWPATWVKVGSANPGLWIMAAVALGTLYRWPAAFAMLKPTVMPFALIGIRSPAWWATLVLLGLASLPVLELTLAYPGVLLNARGGDLYYSLWDLPMLLVPVIASGASRRP